MASAASIARRNLPQKSSSQPTLAPTLYSQKRQVAGRRVGGILAGRRVVHAAVRLLDLGVEIAHGDPELGPRLQYPQARDLQAVVVPVRDLDQLAEHRVAEAFPPPDLLRRLSRDDRSVGLLPLLQYRRFGLHEVGTHRRAACECQRQADPCRRPKVMPPPARDAAGPARDSRSRAAWTESFRSVARRVSAVVIMSGCGSIHSCRPVLRVAVACVMTGQIRGPRSPRSRSAQSAARGRRCRSYTALGRGQPAPRCGYFTAERP